jgi:DNA-binding NarL/FixJ family response regulator
LTDKTNREIAEELGKSSAEFKKERVNIKDEQKALRRSQVFELRKKGWSNLAISRMMNVSVWTINSIVGEG